VPVAAQVRGGRLLGYGASSANRNLILRHRTTARGALFLTLLAALTTGAAAAHPPQDPGAKHNGPTAKASQTIVFPVVGQASFGDDFGDPRGQGGHQGIDIVAPRRALAVAAEGGTVTFWTTSRAAGCMLYLHGESGTTYLYIHLNNDLGKGNDNRGDCVPGVAYAPGLQSGDRVEAGEPVGFVGDSGDANGISPHLHFELHPGGGGAANPFKALKAAQRLLFSARQGTTFTLALAGTIVGAENGGLQVKVDSVRSWPGGRRIAADGRIVGVTVPQGAMTDAKTVSALAALSSDSLRGRAITILTTPAKVTLAAQQGAPGTLTAARISLAS
jgi:murein DD-endopeptidase MepM/ murein hydrolase activator NlpD